MFMKSQMNPKYKIGWIQLLYLEHSCPCTIDDRLHPHPALWMEIHATPRGHEVSKSPNVQHPNASKHPK